MDFQAKYTSTSEKDKIENKDKKVISDDAYAIGELLNELLRSLGTLSR